MSEITNKDFYYTHIKEKYGCVREVQEEMRNTIIECDKNNKNVLISIPTGAGKTFGAFYTIFFYINTGYRSILCSPLKALTSEQTEELNKFGINVLIIDGDNPVNKKKIKTTDWDVLVTTYEMLDSLIRSRTYSSDIFESENKVKAIIIDEIHTIGNDRRGSNLESLIITKNIKYPDIKIIGLSATIKNYKEFGNWLNSKVIYRDESARPIPLKKEIVEYEQNYDFKKNFNSKLVKLSEIIEEYKNYNMLVFCSSRDNCEKLKFYFSGKYRDMKFAYHHAGLKKDEKKEIENDFKNGKINIIFATTTLAQGVNLPADIVVMFDVSFYMYLTHSKEYIKDYELHQAMGRAGRPNLTKLKDENGKPFGKSFIICADDEHSTMYKLSNELVNMRSQIPPIAREKFLAWMVSGIGKNEKDIENIAKTNLFNNSMDDMDINDVFRWLKSNNFYELTDEKKIMIAEIGFKTIRMYIQPETTVYFKSIAEPFIEKHINNMSLIDVFLLTLECDEFLNGIVVREKDNKAIECSIRLITEDNERNTDEIADFDERLIKGLAFCFHDYIEEKYNIKIPISNNDRYVISKQVTSLLSASAYIINNKDYQTKIRQLIDLVKSGTLDKEIAEYMKIKGVGIAKAKKMKKEGIKTLTNFMGIKENKYIK